MAALLPILALFTLSQPVSASTVSVEFEGPTVLQASAILEEDMLKGAYYTINEKVQNDGLLNHYKVQTRYGEYQEAGNSALKILLHELNAIAAMKKVETDDTAIASLKESGGKTVEGLKNLFSDPEETIGNAAAGVRGLFNRAKGTIGKRELTDSEDSRLEQLIGLTKSKGEIATKFGVNMYSRNQALQEELNRLARADYFGGLGVGVATSFVPGVGGLVLTTSGTARLLNEAINTTPPSELWLQNKNSLLEIGVDEDTVELFLNNPVFSPASQTLLVSALKSMQGVSNLELFVKVALQASDPVMARVITETAIMTSGYHKNIMPLEKIAPLARLTMGIGENDKRVILLPTDHLLWTKRISEVSQSLANHPDKKKLSFELWTTGTISQLARSNFQEMGWQLHQKAQSELLPESVNK